MGPFNSPGNCSPEVLQSRDTLSVHLGRPFFSLAEQTKPSSRSVQEPTRCLAISHAWQPLPLHFATKSDAEPPLPSLPRGQDAARRGFLQAKAFFKVEDAVMVLHRIPWRAWTEGRRSMLKFESQFCLGNGGIHGPDARSGRNLEFDWSVEPCLRDPLTCRPTAKLDLA